VTFAAPGLCSSARASAWELDPAATRIAFSVKNLSVAYVDGTFRLASGRVVLDDGDLSRSTIEAVIDAGSVDTDEPERDAHLRTSDFLDVIRYPTIAFRSTRSASTATSSPSSPVELRCSQRGYDPTIHEPADMSASCRPVGIVVRHREPDRDTILDVTRPSAVPVSPRRWHGRCQ